MGVRKFVSSTVVSSNFFSQLQSVRHFYKFIFHPLQNKLINIKNRDIEKVLGLSDHMFGHRIEQKVQISQFYVIVRPSVQFCNQFATPNSSETCFAVSTHCKLDYRTGLRSVRSTFWSQNGKDGQNSTVLLNSETFSSILQPVCNTLQVRNLFCC